MWVSSGGTSFDQGQEQDVPVISLCFDYEGVRIRAADRRDRFFVARPAGMAMVGRDRSGEARAQCLLEGFGAIELGQFDEVAPDLDTDADYVVQLDGNVHSYCSFSAYALPQLRTWGWNIEVDPSYPFQVVETDAPWYAAIEPDEERTDWFGLELGIQVDGKRVNMLPAMLELLDGCADGETLEALLKQPARFRVVPVGHNKYLPVPPERLKALMQVLLEMYRGEKLVDGQLCVPRSRSSSVAKLDLALGASARLLWSGITSVVEKARELHQLPKPVAWIVGLRKKISRLLS